MLNQTNLNPTNDIETIDTSFGYQSLNLGAGYKKNPSMVNVDSDPTTNPDILWDLNVTPWPFMTSSIEKINMEHVLEHLGPTTDSFLQIMRELYRISVPNASIFIRVPNPRHDTFLADPTHVRPITPITLAMFSKQRNLLDIANNGSETKLGLSLDVDFEIEKVMLVPDSEWADKLAQGLINTQELEFANRHYINVCQEFQITLRVIKDSTDGSVNHS